MLDTDTKRRRPGRLRTLTGMLRFSRKDEFNRRR